MLQHFLYTGSILVLETNKFNKYVKHIYNRKLMI